MSAALLQNQSLIPIGMELNQAMPMCLVLNCLAGIVTITRGWLLRTSI